MLSAALTAAALCQSCVRDVAPPDEEPGDWTDIPVPPMLSLDVNAIVADGHGTLFLGAERETSLWRSTDRGLTWTEKAIGLNASCAVTALLVKGGETVFAALWGGGVFVSRNHGESWKQVNNHLTNLAIRSLTAAADGAIIAGASNGRIFRSGNDGGVWVEVKGDPIGSEVRALVTDPAGTIYAGFSEAGVYFSADSGRTWTPSSNGLLYPNVYCLAIDSDGYVLAGTGGGGIFRSAGGGEPWVRIDRGTTSLEISAIATDRAGGIIAGTYGGGAIRSLDGGDSWEMADIGLQGFQINSLLCAGDILLAGTWDKGVFRSTDRGSTWSTPRNYFPTDPDRYDPWWSYNSLTIDSCGTYYFLNRWAVLRSRDGGETWVRACSQLHRAPTCLVIHPNSSLFVGTEFGLYVSTDSGDSWSMADTTSALPVAVYDLEVTKNGVLFANTEKGVLRSVNRGTSWENVFSETPVTSMSTGSAGCVYIGTNYRGVLGSTDYGDTWQRMTDSLRIWSIDADRAGNVFAIYEDGILCSGDGGDSWKAIQPGGNYYFHSMAAAPGGEVAIFLKDDGTLYISKDCFSSWRKVPVPYTQCSITLSPDGHLFIGDQVSPGLHRSRHSFFR